MAVGPLETYKAMAKAGTIEADREQLRAARALQLLSDNLKRYRPKLMPHLASIFAISKKSAPPKGLYLYGGVGRGKTMLMDLFFDSIDFEPRQRVHFHEFMSDTHELIAEARKVHEGDPIPEVAKQIALNAKLLCFDELHVRDIADAMILGRLFEALFAKGVVVVATSNVVPDDLYKDGLNRDLFLPFVDLIGEKLDVLKLDAEKDFRLEKFQGQELYFSPLGDAANTALDAVWQTLTGLPDGSEACLILKGRHIIVPQTSLGVARFSFEDLCDQPLGPADFLKVAHTFHTVFIEKIPVMGPGSRDQALRFINLIDSLYDNGVRLVASAEAEPHKLYVSGDNSDLFERTQSRLMEMRSEAYVAGKK